MTLKDNKFDNRAFYPIEPRGLVLDPFASNGTWWKRVTFHGRVIRTDLYPDPPDLFGPTVIYADAAALPFDCYTFDQVWADPPHFIRPDLTGWYKRFGSYKNRTELEEKWRAWGIELSRVTKPGGTLVWKCYTSPDDRCPKWSDVHWLTAGRWRIAEQVPRPSRNYRSNGQVLWTILART